MAPRKITITDIARAAGVSKTTVSRYINGKSNLIGEDSRKRIEAAIEMSNYHPNALARSLKTQRSYLVGVIVADITSPFSSSLISGITRSLIDGGYTPVIMSSDDSPELERTSIGSLISHQVDGLIVNTTTDENPDLIKTSLAGTPVVLCDRTVRDHTFDIALSEYRAPVMQLVDHLARQGYGRAVFCTQPYETNSPRRTRRDAFMEADAASFGQTNPEDDVLVVDQRDPSSVVDAVRKVMATTPTGETPAIVAVNSVTLIAIVNAVASLGLSMPGDIGVCGPDDWGWSNALGWDWTSLLGGGITSFKIDPARIGAEAGKLLIERIGDPSAEKRTITIPTELKIGASTMLGGRG
jgi:LacI family kdg operon repressor